MAGRHNVDVKVSCSARCAISAQIHQGDVPHFAASSYPLLHLGCLLECFARPASPAHSSAGASPSAHELVTRHDSPAVTDFLLRCPIILRFHVLVARIQFGGPEVSFALSISKLRAKCVFPRRANFPQIRKRKAFRRLFSVKSRASLSRGADKPTNKQRRRNALHFTRKTLHFGPNTRQTRPKAPSEEKILRPSQAFRSTQHEHHGPECQVRVKTRRAHAAPLLTGGSLYQMLPGPGFRPEWIRQFFFGFMLFARCSSSAASL